MKSENVWVVGIWQRIEADIIYFILNVFLLLTHLFLTLTVSVTNNGLICSNWSKRWTILLNNLYMILKGGG